MVKEAKVINNNLTGIKNMDSINNVFSRASHLALEAIKLPYRAACWFCSRVVSVVSSVKNYLTKVISGDAFVFGSKNVSVRTNLSDRSCTYHHYSSSNDGNPVEIKGAGKPVTRCRDIGSFQDLSVSGIVNLYWHNAPARPIQITTEPNIQDYIETSVKGGKLTVGLKPGYSISTNKGVTVHVWSPSCNKAEGKGFTKIIAMDRIKQNAFEINMSDHSSFEGGVDVQNLETNISSFAEAKITGNALKHTIRVSGSSALDAGGLKTSQCDIDVSSMASANISCDERLDCKVHGSGALCGNLAVEQLKSAISGFGTVKFTGRATTHHAEISGTGRLEAGKLRTSHSTVEVSSLGSAEVFCEHSLKASVPSITGTLKYAGCPRIEASASSLKRMETFIPR